MFLERVRYTEGTSSGRKTATLSDSGGAMGGRKGVLKVSDFHHLFFLF